MGMVVTTVAIRPEPMPSFCASTTSPMAANAMSVPMRALARHCAVVGQGSPCHLASASITTPAVTKRAPFMSTGGMDCMATSSA